MIERAHQTLGNIICMFTMNCDIKLDEQDPWSGFLAAAQFAMRATVHTTLKASPTQLVVQRDTMLNIPFTANWQQIRKRKQTLIDKNNQRENKRRRQYEYSVNDKILIEACITDKYSKPIRQGPYVVLRITTMELYASKEERCQHSTSQALLD